LHDAVVRKRMLIAPADDVALPDDPDDDPDEELDDPVSGAGSQ
jgi:hypothetical protein